MFKIIFMLTSLSVFIILNGCASIQLEDGKDVRIVTASQKEKSCEFLGTVQGHSGWAATTSGDREFAMNDARNKVAQMGGNGMLVISTDSSIWEGNADILAEALMCKW